MPHPLASNGQNTKSHMMSPGLFGFFFAPVIVRNQSPEASHFVSRQMPLVLELLAIIKRKYRNTSCIIVNPQHQALSVQEL
jgi:hypothetical protein